MERGSFVFVVHFRGKIYNYLVLDFFFEPLLLLF